MHRRPARPPPPAVQPAPTAPRAGEPSLAPPPVFLARVDHPAASPPRSGLYLVYKYYSAQGPKITVRFDTAEGIIGGKTPMLCRSVNIGTVTGVKLTNDLKGVVVTADMTRDATRLLRRTPKSGSCAPGTVRRASRAWTPSFPATTSNSSPAFPTRSAATSSAWKIRP